MDNSSDQGGRPKVIWIPSENPHYKDLLFQFTEKDRLYLIRFNIKQAEKDEIQALKKSFFDTQKFLWEEPLKMKHKDNDILLYIKESGPDCFFDFFNRKTGERSFELFNRAVSVEDRPPKAEEQKAENQSADESSSNGPTPEKLDAKSPEPGSTPVSGEKPDPAKVQTQPQKEGE
ncbi:MAG: hypothetical protein HY912_09885 [Desulfomonile tiedjei]|uniref:Uncharacterized protein n=1 Tax=Desulfomonile tiedjei TaxID=2358 RepID=A0A9D6Z3F4_9BACT|nr:hypothetical protein [Desulfomonile tiedjei]